MASNDLESKRILLTIMSSINDDGYLKCGTSWISVKEVLGDLNVDPRKWKIRSQEVSIAPIAVHLTYLYAVILAQIQFCSIGSPLIQRVKFLIQQ